MGGGEGTGNARTLTCCGGAVGPSICGIRCPPPWTPFPPRRRRGLGRTARARWRGERRGSEEGPGRRGATRRERPASFWFAFDSKVITKVGFRDCCGVRRARPRFPGTDCASTVPAPVAGHGAPKSLPDERHPAHSARCRRLGWTFAVCAGEDRCDGATTRARNGNGSKLASARARDRASAVRQKH